MDTSSQNKINKIIKDGYPFRFGDYLKEAVELMQRNFFGFALLTALIFMGVIFSSVFIYFNLIVWAFVIPVIGLGYSISAHNIQNQKNTTFNDFFLGFERFQTLAILFGIITGISLLASIPSFYYLGAAMENLIEEYPTVEELQAFAIEEPEEYMALVTENIQPLQLFLYLIPLIFIHIIYLFAPHFVYFYKFSAWDAMEASRKLIMKKWIVYLGFSIVIGVISMIGFFFFGIGALLTYLIGPLALYAAFSNITQLNENAVNDDILNHFVE